MLAARRLAAADSQEVNGVLSCDAPRDSEMLYQLVNGQTREVEGKVSLEAVPDLHALLELEESSLPELDEALKAGELAELVVIRPVKLFVASG